MKKIRFIGLNYYCHREFQLPAEVIQKHEPTDLFVGELQKDAEILLVKHMSRNENLEKDGIGYQFFSRSNSFWQIPQQTHKYIAVQNPDIVVVQGLIFPLQVIWLRKKLGNRCKIILQHQGEIPFRRKKVFQKMADKAVDGYLFSSMGIAEEWCRPSIIKDISKCFEIPPASFRFQKQNKQSCKIKAGVNAQINFLWAGRLNANKDPLTVLNGFEKYFAMQQNAKLYMIYQEKDLLEAVKEKIDKSRLLKEMVVLVGKVDHAEMETWYSAADYIVSGSHHEGGSYVLMEAMACGCVPIVTDIPASLKTVDGGRLGYVFEKGNSESFYRVLSSLDFAALPEKSGDCVNHFKSEMSPSVIAGKMLKVIERLQSKQCR